MERITGKEYKKKYDDLKQQMQSLETKIINRAMTLCKKYPDIVLEKTTDFNIFKIYHFQLTQKLTIEDYLNIIDIIETELHNRHPHKQLKIEGF